VTLVLDAGALMAYERGDRTVQAHLERASRTGAGVRTTTGVVAQVWRNGVRQARVALLLRGVAEVEFDRAQARRVGVLLGAAGCMDVVDGSIVDVAADQPGVQRVGLAKAAVGVEQESAPRSVRALTQ
jgi:hypothetical protein